MVHPPDLFHVMFESNLSTNSSALQSFIHTHLHEFDRFIFIFSEVDQKILTPLYIKHLLTGKEISNTQIFLSHLYPKLTEPFISSIGGWFFLREQKNRLVQFWGFTPQQAGVFLKKLDIETPRTCLIFINLDRICYQLDLLLEFHTQLLPLLTPWCGYAFFTQKPQISFFYDWLASQVGKLPEFPDQEGALQTRSTIPQPQWEILSAADINIAFREEFALSEEENKKIEKEYDKFPEKKLLLSNAPRKKQYQIDQLKHDLEGKLVWATIRRLTLGLLVATKISLNQKVLIIADTLEQEMWEAFRRDKSFLNYPSELAPEFLPISEIHKLNTERFLTYDRIILDLGDELIPWVSQPFVENLLNLIALVKYLAPEMKISFFRPLLIEEGVIERILDQPPCPYHLQTLSSEKRQEELLLASILLIVAKRRDKAEFYSLIENYWTSSLIAMEYRDKTSKYLKDLRLLGLIDRQHFQITTLGKWFLENKLFIHTFRELMQEILPPLFFQRLQQPIAEELFRHYYLAATEWLYQTTSFYSFSATKWTILHTAMIHTFRQQNKLAEGLFDEVNDLIIQFFKEQKEIDDERKDYFTKKSREFKKISFKPPSLPEQRTIHWGSVLACVLKDIHEWLNKLDR